jgi:hypothetical protein
METELLLPSSQESCIDPFCTLKGPGSQSQAFFKTCFNIFHITAPRSPNWYLSYVEESGMKLQIKILVRATCLAYLVFHNFILAITGK